MLSHLFRTARNKGMEFLEELTEVMKRIKLLYFISGIDIGGAEQLLLTTVKMLDKKKFDIAVCYLKGRGELRQEFESAGIRIIFLGDYSLWISGRIYSFYRLLIREQFDVLHNHLIRSILIGGICGRLAGVRCILSTEHNTSNWEPRFSYLRPLFRLGLSFSAKVIAISHAVEKCLLEKGKIPAEKILVLHDGIDLSAFNPDNGSDDLKKNLGLLQSFPIIGSVSRLDPRKGHRFLIEAISLLHSEYPEIALLLIGDGKERRDLERQVKELHLERSVLFVGAQIDVVKYLALFDIFVLSSLAEGLSIALIEAMAMKSAIVATNIGGIPEVVENGKEGVLVPPADTKKMAAAIRHVLLNKEETQLMKVHAREKVEKKFDMKNIVKELERVYTNLAGN